MNRLLRLLALALLWATPALADTASFPLTPAWQQVAASGQSVLVSSSSPVFLSTGLSTPSGGGFTVAGPIPLCLTLSQNLYVGPGTGAVTVTTGVTCGGGGTSTVNQGTSPWVENMAQVAGQPTATGAGATTAGTQRVIMATDSGLATAANQSNETNGSAVTGPGQRVMGSDGTLARDVRTTTTGALEPVTAASGKVTQTQVTLAASTSTTLVAANASRIALELQCDGTAPVGVDRSGGTLTSPTAAPLVIPTGSYPLYTFPVAPLTAVTGYTATSQVCRVTEYNR